MKTTSAKSGRSRRRLTRGLVLERLETRALLAGNVTAARHGNNLVIRGDNASNEIAIVATGEDEYTVTGVDTTVNGDEARTFSGITGNIDVDLRGGNDILTIADDPTGLDDVAGVIADGLPVDLTGFGTPTSTDIDAGLIIRMNSGNDTVSLSVDVARFADISTGTGNDRVEVLSSDFGAHLNVRAEDGADDVVILDVFVGTSLNVNTGRGSDGLLVQQLDVRSVVANAGRDSDVLGLFDILADGSIVVIGDHGNDDIDVEFAEASFLSVNGGDGNDLIDIDGVEIFGGIVALGGGGNDTIEVEPNDDFTDADVELGAFVTSATGAVVIDGGAGNDSLEAELVEARSIVIVGGSGNDFLDADGVLTENHLIVNGGAGNDSVDVGASDDDEFEPGLPAEIGTFLHVILGAGNDEAFIFDTTVGTHILVDAGAGDDFVEFGVVEAIDHVLVLMGAGNNDELAFFAVIADEITLDGGSGRNDTLFIDFTTGRRIRNFENVNIDVVDDE